MIYPRKSLRDNGFEWLKKEGARAGFSVDIAIDDTLSWGVGKETLLFVDGVKRDLPDIAVMRHYDTAVSLSFERLGVRTVNTSASMSLSYIKVSLMLHCRRPVSPCPKRYGAHRSVTTGPRRCSAPLSYLSRLWVPKARGCGWYRLAGITTLCFLCATAGRWRNVTLRRLRGAISGCGL